MASREITGSGGARIALPFIVWLGGAFYVGHKEGFWDGVVWLWYLGRYIAANFTILHY